MHNRQIGVLYLGTDGRAQYMVVDNSANALHDLVGGYFEVFYVKDETTDPMNSIIGLCDEDGWHQSRPVNPYSMLVYRQPIAGDIVLVRATLDGDFVSLTQGDVIRLLLRFGLIVVDLDR